MAQAIEKPMINDPLALAKRIEELESILRTVLEQINTHQVYDKDARVLIKRALGSALTQEAPAAPSTIPVRPRGEFPSLFPATTPSNFI